MAKEERERERIARSFLPRCIVYEPRERERGVSVSIIIECLDYQLDFRGVHGRAWWNRRTKEEKIRLGGDERAERGGRRSLPSAAKLGRSEEARNERRFSRRRPVLIRVTALNSKLP